MQSLELTNLDNQPQTLVDGWSRFIEKFSPYDLYVTLTFEQDTHPEQADRRYKRFVRKINQSLFGRRYREQEKGIYWVRALELQRRQVIHFHALLGGGAFKLNRIAMTELWKSEKGNGHTWIERFDPLKGATRYLSKYVGKSKRGEIDWFIPYALKRHFGIEEDINNNFDFPVMNKAIPVITRNSNP